MYKNTEKIEYYETKMSKCAREIEVELMSNIRVYNLNYQNVSLTMKIFIFNCRLLNFLNDNKNLNSPQS